MAKKIILPVCLCVVLLAAVTVVLCRQEKTDMDDLADLWRDIYGANRIVKLPEREVYALLMPAGKDDFATAYLKEFSESDDWRWDELYTGEDYSLTAFSEKYGKGEAVYFELSNNTDTPIQYGYKYLIDIQINGKWYPVIPFEIRGGLAAISLAANETARIDDISPKGLCSAKLYEYNEDSKEYEYVSNEERFGRDIYLIPGHYRFMKDIYIEKPDGATETIFLACEFDVVG